MGTRFRCVICLEPLRGNYGDWRWQYCIDRCGYSFTSLEYTTTFRYKVKSSIKDIYVMPREYSRSGPQEFDRVCKLLGMPGTVKER